MNTDQDFKKLLSSFYKTPEWKELRDRAMQERNFGRCDWCQVIFSFEDWQDPVVDHILPIRYFPDKGLDINNCQILCRGCNSKKASTYGAEANSIRQKIVHQRLEFLNRAKYRGEKNADIEISYLLNPIERPWAKNKKTKKQKKKEKFQDPIAKGKAPRNYFQRNRHYG